MAQACFLLSTGQKPEKRVTADKVGNSAAALRKELAAGFEGARYAGDLWSRARALFGLLSRP